jgi:hypothetical protein
VKSHRLELLAELTAHKLEIIEVLTTPPPESRAWLDSVADLLGCSAEHLLTRRFIDRDDLREQHTTHPRFAARLIGCNPFWTTPPPATPANSAANDSTAPETEQQPITPTGYMLAASWAIGRYPFLDSDSHLANQTAIDETISLRDQFIAQGYMAGTAIRMAAEVVGGKYAE